MAIKFWKQEIIVICFHIPSSKKVRTIFLKETKKFPSPFYYFTFPLWFLILHPISNFSPYFSSPHSLLTFSLHFSLQFLSIFSLNSHTLLPLHSFSLTSLPNSSLHLSLNFLTLIFHSIFSLHFLTQFSLSIFYVFSLYLVPQLSHSTFHFIFTFSNFCHLLVSSNIFSPFLSLLSRSTFSLFSPSISPSIFSIFTDYFLTSLSLYIFSQSSYSNFALFLSSWLHSDSLSPYFLIPFLTPFFL